MGEDGTDLTLCDGVWNYIIFGMWLVFLTSALWVEIINGVVASFGMYSTKLAISALLNWNRHDAICPRCLFRLDSSAKCLPHPLHVRRNDLHGLGEFLKWLISWCKVRKCWSHPKQEVDVVFFRDPILEDLDEDRVSMSSMYLLLTKYWTRMKDRTSLLC